MTLVGIARAKPSAAIASPTGLICDKEPFLCMMATDEDLFARGRQWSGGAGSACEPNLEAEKMETWLRYGGVTVLVGLREHGVDLWPQVKRPLWLHGGFGVVQH